jgi:hypothetical protein
MGWKSLKNYFLSGPGSEGLPAVTGLEIVFADKHGVYFGTGLGLKLIVVTNEGAVHVGSLLGERSTAFRLAERMRSNPEKLLELLKAEDVFERSLPVFSYSGSSIVEDFCESYGALEVTHSGQIMDEERFFPTKAAAIQAGIANASADVEYFREKLNLAEKEALQARGNLRGAEAALASFSSMA